MTETTKLEAKVLLIDPDPVERQKLVDFCVAQGLMPLESEPGGALSLLEAHQDLAGLMISEALLTDASAGLAWTRSVHKLRPELPVFLRRTSARALSPQEREFVQFEWSSSDMEQLRSSVDRTIFSLRYPTPLVHGIVELTCSALRSMFPNAVVEAQSPYVVHDRIIQGEVSTLIAIESTWCRGYMMLQTEENALRQGLIAGLSYEGLGGELSFRDLNNMLGETTNLIWGAFKNCYIPPEAFANQQTQVPIVINHAHKYISFGSTDPQLCIRYNLSEGKRPELPPLVIVQRFIFNLHWSPDQFAEYSAAADSGPTGELDLF